MDGLIGESWLSSAKHNLGAAQMEKIVHVPCSSENYSEDWLAGKPLKHFEAIRVQWPDGTTTEEHVTLFNNEPDVNGGGYRNAYIAIMHRGATAYVSMDIAGLLAERI